MTQHQSSPMSITQLVHSSEQDNVILTTNDIDDPDVKIAAEVLGDMARLSNIKKENKSVITLPPLSAPSTTPSSPLPTPTASSFPTNERLSFSSESTMDEENMQQRNFIHRVSNIPLVNTALRAYESSKNSSTMVKYGAEMVESFATPIYDKFGKHALSSVDEWGCKQLDRLEERYPDYVAPKDDEDDEDDAKSATYALSRTSLRDDTEGLRKRRDSREETITYHHKSKSRNPSRSTSPHRPYCITKPVPNSRHRQTPLARSKWHQIVMHASSAAGTTAAVISEESMKCLRYCLYWLQYASQHIDQQMNLLRTFLVSLASKPNNKQETSVIQDNASTTLAGIKKEIVDTLRKVVDVISKYAGTGLPEQAKQAVRGFILALPTRWAILNSSTTASPAASPAMKPVDSNVHETSVKLLNFGGESVEMINSVAHVFSDTIDRAELWLNRLRVVGVAGGRSPSSSSSSSKPTAAATTTTTSSAQNEPEQMDLN